MREEELHDAARQAMQEARSVLLDLDERSRTIFRELVESYLANGEPVGSRNISRQLPMTLSPASVRNVMADLEAAGLIFAPHTSAGRMPTETGLRLFVDGLLQVGDLSDDERGQIKSRITGGAEDMGIEDMLGEAGEMLSGLAGCAGVVLADKESRRLRQIEFVALDKARALAVLVGEDGSVENRVVNLPEGLSPSALVQAANYLNARIAGLTLADAIRRIETELTAKRAELDELTARVVQQGLAVWSGEQDGRKNLIVRGRSHLLDDLTAIEDLERIRLLFDDLDTKQELIDLLGHAERADGVRIFIGSENKLFSLSGSSLIVAPFQDSDRQIVGVLGVIGPTRLNYARIIPMVDYTATLVGRLLP
ncbi:MAG: heat-inducible transcriptional repressor HrcA [Hyphomicrobiales bacterium]|nr:heat-inducible transcriptional repressor HrcA [Hyphomicrobiales bacterium]